MHFLSLVDASFRRYAYFVLRLPARPYLGLVRKAASPPIVSWCAKHGWNVPIVVIVKFYKVICLTPYTVGKYRGIWSILEGYSLIIYVRRFRKAPKLLADFISIFARSGEFLCPIFFELYALVFELKVIRPLFWRHSCGIIVPWFPVTQGTKEQ